MVSTENSVPSGGTRTLYIAHRLSDALMLLIASDVSAVYTLHDNLTVWAGVLSAAGVLLSAFMAVIVSRWLAKPYKQLAQQRQELIDALAHEMRTPLTAILGGARLLERARLDDAQQKHVLSTVAREAQRLTDMDERLLMLTRMQHQAASFTQFSSMEMAEEALRVFDHVTLSGESVLAATENVIVGVYLLSPADFDGESVYVILPGTCLTDKQLLSIIAAYDELGLVFDPSTLNYRNCYRGGDLIATRFFTGEENDRYLYMSECLRHGRLILPEDSLQALRIVNLESAYFYGASSFIFMPYRSMTDEELVQLLVHNGFYNERAEIDHDAVEGQARHLLHQTFHCPLSMKPLHIFPHAEYQPVRFTADGSCTYDIGNSRPAYGAHFSHTTPEGLTTHASALFDQATGGVRHLSVTYENPNRVQHTMNTAIVTQEMINTTIAQVEKELNLSGLTWHTIWQNQQGIPQNGYCIPVRAAASETWPLTVWIGSFDGQVHSLDLSYGTLVSQSGELRATPVPDGVIHPATGSDTDISPTPVP